MGPKWLARHGRRGQVYRGRLYQRLTFRDHAASVIDDVTRIRNYPLVPDDNPTDGYIYEVKSGTLVEVLGATAAGKAA